MKRVSDDFLHEALAQTNVPIHLVAVEISAGYVSTITPIGTSKDSFRITNELQQKLNSGEVDVTTTNTSSGEVWIATFENSNNIGSRKLLTSITDHVVTIDQNVDNFFNANATDKVRFSKYLCLAMSNQDFEFYFPDSSSSTENLEVTYRKFPFSLVPMGSSIDGEMMSMNVDVSNVNLLVGNIVQEVDGLRGNRITHLMTFEQFKEGGSRFDCLEENMYIDSVTISNQVVAFKLESRFNIMSLQLPLCNYNRNFCRWRFRSTECGWTEGLNTTTYPLARANACDHSLLGPNGCLAHENTVRFGGFPSISAR